MNETRERAPAPISLMVERAGDGSAPLAWDDLAGVGGVVADAAAGAIDDVLSAAGRLGALAVVRRAGPQTVAAWRERPDVVWVADGPLDEVARQRDAWPDLRWVVRAEVRKVEARYRFRSAPPGEGFSVYMPDPAAIQGFEIAAAGSGALEPWLARAAGLGLDALWLHGTTAARRGRGLELDLLERARRHDAPRIWLSGGASGLTHLENLRRAGGAVAVVLPAGFLERHGLAAALAALGHAPASTASEPAATMTVFDISERLVERAPPAS